MVMSISAISAASIATRVTSGLDPVMVPPCGAPFIDQPSLLVRARR